MQVELNSDVALSAANALLSHLRRNPDAAFAGARDLATQFGLDEAFVSQVLQNVSTARRFEPRQSLYKRSALHKVGGAARNVWMALTKRPIAFVIATSVIGVLAMIAVGAWMPHGRSMFGDAVSIARAVALGSIAGGMLLLHMAVYFRHRSARNALYGGLFVWIGLMFMLALAMLTGNARTTREGNSGAMFVMAGTAMALLSLMYVGFGSLAAVLGGWTRIKLEEREEETMSRQDLLERYFELQARLQKSVYPRPGNNAGSLFDTAAVIFYRRFQFIANVVIGFALSAIELLGTQASGISPGRQPDSISIWIFAVMLISVAKFVFYIFQGYLSRTPWRAAFGAVGVALGSLTAQFLPMSELTRRTLGAIGTSGYWVSETIDVLIMVGVACAGYLGAVVQNRALRDANLQRNDQATLLAEMVRIQWRLSNEASAVCVMVVDAARSSEMKAEADPLAVEYTFREYQEWIEGVSAERGGRVHSTAGDGAVVAFATCPLALSAARKLQTDIFQFNKDVNRLSKPFRLRIGLHTGEVAGDINQVQFTEVIDIAAHIESACPVGGIAVTDEVAQRLPEEQFINLGVQMDGHEVFMVSNATEFP